jgi:hypothetical protein
MLFYWWPVWVLGFALGLLSFIGGYRLAIVPDGAHFKAPADGKESTTYTLVIPERAAASWKTIADSNIDTGITVPVLASKEAGVLFCFVLLAVIFATTIPLRGLWSVIVLMLLVFITIIFLGLGLWDPILQALGNLHIYISGAGYLFVATVLCILWVVTVFFFDPRRYITFAPGQLIVHQEVGDMRQIYDATHVTIEKLRSDFFRHVMLGFYAGDVVIRTPGTQGQTFLMPNVLFASAKVNQVADLMRTRVVTTQ